MKSIGEPLARDSLRYIMSGMTSHEAKRLRNLINGMSVLLEKETDPTARLQLKNAIRQCEMKLTHG